MSQDCLAGCCPHPGSEGADPALSAMTPDRDRGCPPDLPAADLSERINHLYVCKGLSTYRIAGVVQISRQRVNRLLHRSGVPVKPKGAGRQRPQRIPTPFPPPFLADLYLCQRLTSIQISAMTGIPARTIRDRLVSYGVRMRTKGRLNREDRLAVEPDLLAELYLRAGMSSGEVGKILGVSHRVVLRSAHDEGLPVRMGGHPPGRGPAEIELVDALYADPGVQRVVIRYGLPKVPAGGPIWERFPVPARISGDLAAELYLSCGLASTHIELLTGQPAASVRRLLRKAGVPLRPPGGRSPFLRQWRTSRAEG